MISFFLFLLENKKLFGVAMVVLLIYRRYVCIVCTKRMYCLLDKWRRHMYFRLVPMRMMESRYARTHAGGFFEEVGFFCLFVLFGKRGSHMYVCVAEGEEEGEG